MPATQPPTQPPTAPGPPQSCCSEGTEACAQTGGLALPWPLSQPWGHRQLGHPRLQGLESPIHLGWTGSFGHSHTLPAHLPLSSPSSVLGRAPPPPPPPGPQVEGGQALPSWRLPQPLHRPSPLCSPQLLPLWALYPPRPEPAGCLGFSQTLQVGNPLGRNALRASLFHRQCRDNSWGSGAGAPTGPSLASVTLTTTGTGPFYQTAVRPSWARTSAAPPLPIAWGPKQRGCSRLAGSIKPLSPRVPGPWGLPVGTHLCLLNESMT